MSKVRLALIAQKLTDCVYFQICAKTDHLLEDHWHASPMSFCFRMNGKTTALTKYIFICGERNDENVTIVVATVYSLIATGTLFSK